MTIGWCVIAAGLLGAGVGRAALFGGHWDATVASSVMAVCFMLVLLAICLTLPRGASRRSFRGHEDGSSTINTLLTLVPLMVLLALLVQSALIAHASVMVKYASFSSARAAIVHPEGPEDPAYWAAVSALSGISPPGAAGPGTLQEGTFTEHLERLPSPYYLGRGTERMIYAESNTSVSVTSQTFLDSLSGEVPGFLRPLYNRVTDWFNSLIPLATAAEWRTPTDIEVSVNYNFYLSIPFARNMLADSRGGQTTTLRARTTLRGMSRRSLWELFFGTHFL